MTDDQRRKRPSHHIVHDYVNLISAAKEIERQPNSPLNSHVQYSFILQYRKFADFFSNKRRKGNAKKGDKAMLAKDFVSSKIRYKLSEWKKWDDHMNGHIFHINYFRTRNTRPWEGHKENPKMLEEFRVAWKLFFDSLPASRKAEFREEVDLKRAGEFVNLDLYSGWLILQQVDKHFDAGVDFGVGLFKHIMHRPRIPSPISAQIGSHQLIAHLHGARNGSFTPLGQFRARQRRNQ